MARSRTFSGDLRGPLTEPPTDERDYVPSSLHHGFMVQAHAARRPHAYPDLPLGTWMLEEFETLHGRQIYELASFDPLALVPTEFHWDDPSVGLGARRILDAEQYARWLGQGHTPPPIMVVEHESGELRVTNGHRRLLAAAIAGVPIRAWVSWSVPHPEGLRDAVTGAVLPVGLTYELAHPRVANQDAPPLMLGKTMPAELDPTGWWASEKLDGVRAYWDGEKLVSRRGNVFAAPAWFTEDWPKTPLDGELFGGRGKFNETSGIVRRQAPHAGWKGLVYFAFDLPQHPGSWRERQNALRLLTEAVGSPYLAALPQVELGGKNDLQLVLEKIEQAGGEGVMLVHPDARYHVGRSPKLLKVKSFEDDEGVVVRHEPGKGRHAGRMGALWVRDKEGREFKVGTGFSDAQRDRAKALFPPGTVITYQFFERTPKGKPRFPSFLRVRAEEPAANPDPHETWAARERAARMAHARDYPEKLLPTVLGEFPPDRRARIPVDLRRDTITIYRAVPPGVTQIRPGDWVALDRGYAAELGRGRILKKTVPLRHVMWAGTDEHEWFYVPHD